MISYYFYNKNLTDQLFPKSERAVGKVFIYSISVFKRKGRAVRLKVEQLLAIFFKPAGGAVLNNPANGDLPQPK